MFALIRESHSTQVLRSTHRDSPLGRGFLTGKWKSPEDMHRPYEYPHHSAQLTSFIYCSKRL